MARREHLDGLNRCGLPGLHSLEPPSVLEMLEHRAAQQDAIVQNLIIQNRRLLAIHKCLRQDRHNTEKEIQMIQADFGDAEALSDMQTREMVGKIRIMEAEIRAGAAMKKELHQVHLEADKLCAKRQELTTEIQTLTEEVEKVEKSSEGKNSLPELHAELDGLQKEYRSLRSVFEYKRDINTKQVEQMRTMEKNLIAMTKEADKLRAEVQNAKMRAQASAGQSGMAQAQAAPAGTEPYGSAYGNIPAAYQQATQACQSHPPAPSAGIYHYASAYAYSPAAACQQTTQAGPYAYAVPYEDANPMAYHQAVEASGYAGYPVAGYDQQHALSYYPGYPAGYDENALSNFPAASKPGCLRFGPRFAESGGVRFPVGPSRAEATHAKMCRVCIASSMPLHARSLDVSLNAVQDVGDSAGAAAVQHVGALSSAASCAVSDSSGSAAVDAVDVGVSAVVAAADVGDSMAAAIVLGVGVLDTTAAGSVQDVGGSASPSVVQCLSKLDVSPLPALLLHTQAVDVVLVTEGPGAVQVVGGEGAVACVHLGASGASAGLVLVVRLLPQASCLSASASSRLTRVGLSASCRFRFFRRLTCSAQQPFSRLLPLRVAAKG